MTNSADDRLSRVGRLRSLQLGATKVTYVPDGAVQLPTQWLPDSTDEVWAAHPEYLDESGHLVGSIGGLLVEHGDRALLIDAGFGPQSFPAQPGGPYGAIYGGELLDNLIALGRPPERIEAVAFTHLHTDHLGWAWQPAPGGDQPALGEAAYLIAEPEWSQRTILEAHGTTSDIMEIFRPRVRTVADGEEIFPGVRVLLTLGHTVGHTAYVITGGGQRLIAFGDAMHSSIQADYPEWSAGPDHDAELSAEFRHRLVALLAEPDTIGFGGHFADVEFGRVSLDGSGPAWRPVD